MILSLGFVAGAFLVSTVTHVVITRRLHKKRIYTMKSACAYGIGLALLAYLAATRMLPLPATSIVLYMAASVIVIWFSFGAFLGGETPSSMILASYKKNEGKTEQQFRRLFTTEGLILKRINDLVSYGYISKRNKRLILTQKGNIVFRCIAFYQKLFFRKEIG